MTRYRLVVLCHRKENSIHLPSNWSLAHELLNSVPSPFSTPDLSHFFTTPWGMRKREQLRWWECVFTYIQIKRLQCRAQFTVLCLVTWRAFLKTPEVVSGPKSYFMQAIYQNRFNFRWLWKLSNKWGTLHWVSGKKLHRDLKEKIEFQKSLSGQKSVREFWETHAWRLFGSEAGVDLPAFHMLILLCSSYVN